MLRQLLQHTILKFLSVGVINTLLSITLIFGLKYFANFGDFSSNLIGYIVGLLCSFVLNKCWTFNDTSNTWVVFPKFVLVFAVSYLSNILVVLFFIRLGGNDYIAHLVGMPFYTMVFYLGSRYFVFLSPKP